MKGRAITRRRSKLAVALVGAFGVLLTLALVAGVIAPRFIDMPALRRRIVVALSERLGGEVSLGQLRLSFLPAPHVVADDLHVSIHGVVEGGIASVSVYPRILSLLSGKLQPGRLQLTAPDLRVQLPQPSGATEPASGDGALGGLKDRIAAAVAHLASLAAAQVPGLTVTVQNGQIHLFAGEGQDFRFTDIGAHVRFPPEMLNLDVTCASNLWERMSLHAALDPVSVKGDGRIQFTKLRPHALSGGLLPATTLRLTDSEVTLRAHIVIEGIDAVRADVDATSPALRVVRHTAATVIKDARLTAALRIEPRAVEVTLSDLRCGYPPVHLSGSLAADRAAPQASATLEAKNVDVASAREVAAVLAGDSSVSHAIFDVLRSGHVPQVTFEAHGRQLTDLGDLSAMVIRGRLADGRIRVPPGLDLADVAGDVTIANGLLVGEHAMGRLDGSRASAGSVRLGLSGAAPPLHVEAKVQADAAELPPLLKRLVTNATLSAVLERVSNVRGTAAGDLILDGNTEALATTADVSAFKLSGRLQGVSTPVQVAGGRFLYDARGIAATDLTVATGGSTLSQVSVRLSWTGTPASLQVTAGDSRIVLDELYPALVASGWVRNPASMPATLKGTVIAKTLQMDGPAETPAEWQFKLTGAAEKLEIDSQWRGERIGLRRPVSLSALRMARNGTTGSLAAGFAAADNLAGTVDLAWRRGELALKKLTIRDKQSDASISLLVKNRQFDLTFAGSLSASTVDAVVTHNPFLGGWVRGDLRTQILLDQLTRSTAQGTLEASELFVPVLEDVSLSVRRVSLDANVTDTGVTGARASGTGRVNVDATIEAGANRNLHLRGSVRPAPEAFIADLDLAAGHIQWDELRRLVQRSPNGTGDGGKAGEPSSSKPLLRGALRVAAESFTYGSFTWAPLRATMDVASAGRDINVTEANLCGIDTPAKITNTPQGLMVSAQTTARNQQLLATLTCLAGERAVTGEYDLAGKVSARGTPAEIVGSLRGHVELNAQAGRIENMGMATTLLSVLSAATGSVANLAQLGKEGLAYDTVRVTGDLKGGTLALKEAVLDGPSVKVVGEGSMDLIQKTVDVTLLVAPLKTVDSLVSRIPVIGNVLGGSLVSIPVKVSGDLRNPSVTPLAPSVVGERLVGLMSRTLKLPMQVIQPLLPGR